jgi:predicted ATPase
MIHSISVNGYRLLDAFEANFKQLTVIVGANATGKSTLLDCLMMIPHTMDAPLQEAINWHGGMFSLPTATNDEKRIGWTLKFEKPTNNPIWRDVPLNTDQTFVYEVRLSGDRYGQPVAEYECLRNADPHRGYTEPLKYLEATRDRTVIYDAKRRALVPFDAAVPQQPSSPSAGAENSPPPGAEALPEQVKKHEETLGLARMRFFNEYPVQSWARALLSNMAFYTGFDIGRLSSLRLQPAEIRPETTLQISGANLGTVLHEVLTRYEYRAAAEELRDFVRVAYPSFEDVTAETTHGSPPKVLVRIRERGIRRSLELWDLSDGMLRFLCLTAALLNPAPPPFIAVDEPEVGLHPRLLPIVADLLKRAAEQSQVVLTTHSPDLLNRFELDDVAVMSRDETRAVWHRPSTKDALRKLLLSVTGETLGDFHRSGELEALS